MSSGGLRLTGGLFRQHRYFGECFAQASNDQPLGGNVKGGHEIDLALLLHVFIGVGDLASQHEFAGLLSDSNEDAADLIRLGTVHDERGLAYRRRPRPDRTRLRSKGRAPRGGVADSHVEAEASFDQEHHG